MKNKDERPDREKELELGFLTEKERVLPPPLEVDFEEAPTQAHTVSRLSYDRLDRLYQSNKTALSQKTNQIAQLYEEIKYMKGLQAQAVLSGRGKRWRETVGVLLIEIAERGRK